MTAAAQRAAEMLQAAKTKEMLTSVWWRDCEHFSGADREYLQEVYSQCLSKMRAMVG